MLRKRIGIIMYQTSNSRGQELVAQRMVRNFNRLGQKAYLITSRFHDGREVVPAESFRKLKGYLYVEDSMLKMPVIRVDSYTEKLPPHHIIFRYFIHTLEKIVDDFGLNVLITHSMLWNGPEETAKFVTWRRDMRRQAGYQDSIVLCHMSHFQEPSSLRYSLTERAFRMAWNKLSLSKVLDTANLVLVVTPYEKASKVKMGVKAEKCFLYPGGVDDELFLRLATDDIMEFRDRHGIRPKARIISYLGSIEERKNPMAVLKVAEMLKDKKNLHFVMAGKGDSTYAGEVERLARSLPNVTYLGEIEEREKVLLVRASYLNIILSRLEALGIVQLEFMYCGIPVITSGTGGQSWVIQSGIEGLHVKGPDDIRGAADAILQLVEDRDTYRQMAHNAQKKASRFTISEITSQLDSAIDVEMAKESGLTEISSNFQDTLSRPEHVIKTWAFGTTKIVATDKRTFIRQGILSRKITELRYGEIKSIEHERCFPWKTPLAGFSLSALLSAVPSLQSIFSETVVQELNSVTQNIVALVPAQVTLSGNLLPLLSLLPAVISVIMFFSGIKSRFNLYSPGKKPIHLSAKFREALAFIREYQDNQLTERIEDKPDYSPDILKQVPGLRVD